MSKTRLEWLADIEAALTRATAEAEIRTAIVSKLPEAVIPQVQHIHAGGYRCDGSVKIAVEKRADVLPLLDALPPIPVLMVKNSSLSFVPESRIAAKERDDNATEKTPVEGVLWKVDKVGSYPASASVEWWADLGLYVIKVEVAVTKDRAYYEEAHQRDARRRITKHQWVLRKAPGGHVVNWWAEHDKPKPHTVYWRRGEVDVRTALVAGEQEDGQ